MLKYVLLATTMCIAAPAFAQETTPADTETPAPAPVTEAAPAASEAAPAAETPAPTDTASAPMPTQPEAQQPVAGATSQPITEPVAPAETVAAAPAPAPAPAAAPATTQDQVAQVVTAEFGTYDKNADGSLDQAEFTAWMTALRTASDPAFAANSAEGQAWLAKAFAAADADKNSGVNATELTSFLTPKPAA